MTAICVIGTELSAHFQDVLIIAQVLALLVFAGVALVRGPSPAPARSTRSPRMSWLNPFGAGGAALTGGLLLGVFAYWGWESAVNLNEETEDSSSTPAGPRSSPPSCCWSPTCRWRSRSSPTPGTDFLTENADEEEAIFASLADEVHGRLVLGGAARRGHLGDRLHPDHDHPGVPDRAVDGPPARAAQGWPTSTRASAPRTSPPGPVAVIAIVWYLVVNLISENALFDSLTALSLLIAFYYALTGIACAIYYRRELTKSAKNFLLIGVGPVIGAILLFWLLVQSIIDMSDPENSYTGVAWFGVGPPLVIGVGDLPVGVVFMIFWRMHDGPSGRSGPAWPTR